MNFSEFLKEEEQKDYFINLKQFVDEEYNNHICYPKYENILLPVPANLTCLSGKVNRILFFNAKDEAIASGSTPICLAITIFSYFLINSYISRNI